MLNYMKKETGQQLIPFPQNISQKLLAYTESTLSHAKPNKMSHSCTSPWEFKHILVLFNKYATWNAYQRKTKEEIIVDVIFKSEWIVLPLICDKISYLDTKSAVSWMPQQMNNF